MTINQPARVLIVTDHTEVAPPLLEAIRKRTSDGPALFRVLVTNPARTEAHLVHPERHEKAAQAERALRETLPSLLEVAGGHVIGSVSVRHDPYLAVEELLASEPIDEFIIALAPHGLSSRLHLDLAHRLRHLDRPITDLSQQPALQHG